MYRIIENSKKGYGVKIIVAESKNDLKDVPLSTYAPGSKAYVIEESKTYMLGFNKKWEVSLSSSSDIGGASGSGSGSDSQDGSGALDDEYTIIDGGTAAG